MFDSISYLQDFTKGNYPKIHDNIFNHIIQNNILTNSIDLCCCYGLLAERLNNNNIFCIGIEKNKFYISKSKEFNLKTKIFELDVFNSFNEIENLIKRWQIETIIARRCIPELFSKNIEKGNSFAKMLHTNNVNQIILEGRIVSTNSKNSLCSIYKEIELFRTFYNPEKINNNICTLKKR